MYPAEQKSEDGRTFFFTGRIEFSLMSCCRSVAFSVEEFNECQGGKFFDGGMVEKFRGAAVTGTSRDAAIRGEEVSQTAFFSSEVV